MATVDATLPTSSVNVREAGTLNLAPIMTGSTATFNTAGSAIPPGLTGKPTSFGATYLQGTPTAAGSFILALAGRDDAGDYTEQVESLTVHVVVPGLPNVPATHDMTIPPDEPVAVILQGLRSKPATKAWRVTGTVPPGLSPKPAAFNASSLEGTPTETGTWTVNLESDLDNGDMQVLTLTVGAAVTVIPVPAAEATEDGYMLPEVEGVIWTVDGVEQVPGSYSVEPVEVETDVTILPTTDVGYAFDTEPVPLVLTFLPAPGPDPEPEPEPVPVPGPFDPSPAPDEPDEPTEAVWARLMDDDPQAIYVATRLAERIIRHAGQDVAELEPAEVLTARDHAGTVLEYVRGYVRGRGFVGSIPHRALQAVIVSAGARLFVNPEQLTYYSTGDYSERPATMTGWTHAELGVLRRFRRTYR